MVLFVILIALILSYLAYFNTEKKLTPIERYATLVFASFLSLWVDVTLGLIYNQYFYFEKGVHWNDFLFHFGIYPAISNLFLNSFPFKNGYFNKILYIFGWSVISIGYELFFKAIGVFVYQGYHLWYSFIAYPMLFISLLLNLKFINHLRRKSIPKGDISEV